MVFTNSASISIISNLCVAYDFLREICNKIFEYSLIWLIYPWYRVSSIADICSFFLGLANGFFDLYYTCIRFLIHQNVGDWLVRYTHNQNFKYLNRLLIFVVLQNSRKWWEIKVHIWILRKEGVKNRLTSDWNNFSPFLWLRLGPALEGRRRKVDQNTEKNSLD